MNRRTVLKDSMDILFEQYNQGKLSSLGFCSFTLKAGQSNSYKTMKSAIIVPVSGRAIFSFEDEPFMAKRGLFLHGCPDKMLTLSALENEDFHYINMYYESDQHLLFSRKLKNPDKTISILHQILKMNPDTDIKAQYMLEGLIAGYFNEIFSDFKPELVYNENQIMKDLLNYISVNYKQSVTLRSLAEYVNEKPARISYLFFKYKRIRPIDYLINYRIKIATELLRSGDYTISEAACLVGYKDACYFSRIYKRRMGFPPNRLVK